MDFGDYSYTDEQRRFREEVQAWLAEHVPPEIPEVETSNLNLAMGSTAAAIGDEYLDAAREIRRKLGQKGWLFPTYPKKYGGGGLTHDHEVILTEEIVRRGVPIGYSNAWIVTSLLIWGTETQKERWLTPILRGEAIAYQAFTEPQSGTDLANVRCTAVRDGDEWVINGTKCFVSGPGQERCDVLFGPIMTDPDAPRHRNLGFFVIPAKAPGVEMVPQQLLSGPHHSFVYYSDVRVPADYLIGGDQQGRQVCQTGLEDEHGGRGMPLPADAEAEELIRYACRTPGPDGRLGDDPAIQELVVQSYIDSRIGALLAVRNFSMAAKRMEITYEGSQNAIWSRESGMANLERARDVLGPYALLSKKDPLSPLRETRLSYDRRLPPHAGGTLEIQKTIVARRVGMSRTHERAAPTPLTVAVE